MRRSRQRGFTLIELMVVISIIVILMSVAIPRYQASILHARETVLRDDLYTLRSVIDQYTLDKQKASQSLQDLVDAGYLKDSADGSVYELTRKLGPRDRRQYHVARPVTARDYRRA